MSRWVVEKITEDSANILEEGAGPHEDWLPVGIGFPPSLANRLVEMHNQTRDYYFEGEEPKAFSVVRTNDPSTFVNKTATLSEQPLVGQIRKMEPGESKEMNASDYYWVQIVQGKIVAAFRKDEIVFGVR